MQELVNVIYDTHICNICRSIGTKVRKCWNYFGMLYHLRTMVCKRLNYFITCWPPNFILFAKVLIFVSTCAEDQWQAGGRTSLKNQPLMISKHFLASVTPWCFKLAGGGFALRWWLEAVRTNGGVKPSAWEVLYLSTPAIECKCSDSGTIVCSGLGPIVCLNSLAQVF